MIDKPYVIDRETVKQYLQITGTTYDALIDLYLPIVSEDIDLITNTEWVEEYTGDLTTGSADITNINFCEAAKKQLVSTEDYTQAIIQDLDENSNTITVDQTATQTLSGADVLINQFPIAKRITAAQMVGYQISKNMGIASTAKGSLKSKSIPPLSVTFNDKDIELHSGYGYPKYMVNALQHITRPRFK